MSQLAVDSTVLPPYWQTNSNHGESALVLPPVEAPTDTVSDASLEQPVAQNLQPKALCPCPRWKRAIDIVGASVLLALLSPLFVVIGLYIKCVSRGPVLFRQRRFGLGGRPFQVWKFRTIEVSNAPVRHRSHVAELMANNRPLEKCDDKLEVIPGGGVLRRCGIDELPQLINVLKGEMSLVGPRPDVVPFCDYSKWQQQRFDVLPGITGLWQVHGKNRTTFATMMRLDALYVRRRSFWLDLDILLRTIPAIVLD
jgi:lipopolysaccharide/colanic/teichoic acid biosynthesis glycosyltransferase